jgi:hypothetical protein
MKSIHKYFGFYFAAALVSVLFTISSCKVRVPETTRQSETIKNTNPIDIMAKPPVIVYKTKSDYFDKVPVILNNEKTEIISYPDIRDVYYKGELALPARLADGFLLDNRGIGPGVAFLSYSYQEYAALPETPTAEQLMKNILDKDPLVVMYRCNCEHDSALISGFLQQKQMDVFTRIQ